MNRPLNWHLDRRVPIALVMGLVMQMAVGMWWVSKMDSRMERGEQRMVRLEAHDEISTSLQASVARDLGEIKGQLAILISNMQRERK
jgi:hypothetical protein